MDAVPYKFVDSVVELFDGKKTLDPLANEVRHRLWKKVVDFHHRNRVYYFVYVQIFRTKDSGTHIVAFNGGTEIYSDLKPIQKNRRFARIVAIYDPTDFDFEDDYLKWKHSQILGDVDAAKKLSSIAPQFEQSSHFIGQSADIILSSLSSSIFGKIWLQYNGQTSLIFLEKQIANSPFLDMITLYEGKQFCLKGRPGRHVSLEIRDAMETKIDTNFIQRFFEHWKEKGTLNFTLDCGYATVDPKDKRI
uniref:FBA_2 domain-containing protein n=1 Tax=Steinernema glaseri TaxID=37863 RepID=A0A1I8A032_9BILA